MVGVEELEQAAQNPDLNPTGMDGNADCTIGLIT